MPKFYETIYGKRFLEGQLPSLITALEIIGNELKRSNAIEEGLMKRDILNEELKQIADEIQPYDHKISQVLDIYRRNY